ncbi:Plasma serine protease inhibitor [Lemmus lemmus]
MHRTHCLLLLAGYLLLSHSQPAQESDSTSNQIYTEFSQLNISSDQIIAPGNADFAFRLYHLVASQNSEENIFFSPLSISIALAMLSTGAGGNTQTQILEGLGFNLTELSQPEIHEGFRLMQRMISRPSPEMDISVGNALILNPAVRIRNNFLSAIKTLYMADTLSTNFGISDMAKKQINDYVAKQTKGKIVDLIKKLQSTHVMVLINYIFFKAKWETAFSDKNTHKEDFHVTPKQTIQVLMMNREDEYHYTVDRDISCTVVRLPYQGNATALFVLPNEGKMQQVEKGLNEGALKNWLKTAIKRRLSLYLPKFSIEGTYHLEKILPKLGIKDVFTSHADLSGMTDHANINLSEVVHKAVLDVAETGTEAAAATGIMMMGSALILNPLEVHFDRPFLMIISDTDTQTSLFMAKVTNPKEN